MPLPGRSATYTVVGHKADLLMLHLRPEVASLHDLETEIRSDRARLLHEPGIFVSLGDRGQPACRARGHSRERRGQPLHPGPSLPEIPEHGGYICFYPMSKKRSGDDNWYRLDAPERAELMRDHGRTGRKYAGKVSQIVSGSMGLDDWEWGVTLFSDDPLQFKKLVYEMRFDEVSARYAEFGPFYVGRRLEPDDVGRWLGE